MRSTAINASSPIGVTYKTPLKLPLLLYFPYTPQNTLKHHIYPFSHHISHFRNVNKLSIQSYLDGTTFGHLYITFPPSGFRRILDSSAGYIRPFAIRQCQIGSGSRKRSDALWIAEDSHTLLSSADDDRSLKLSETTQDIFIGPWRYRIRRSYHRILGSEM